MGNPVDVSSVLCGTLPVTLGMSRNQSCDITRQVLPSDWSSCVKKVLTFCINTHWDGSVIETQNCTSKLTLTTSIAAMPNYFLQVYKCLLNFFFTFKIEIHMLDNFKM